jgi:hypothetical protein
MEAAQLFNKSEETIKRWLRSGKFPNAVKENDKKGWQIPTSDLDLFQSSKKSNHQSSPPSRDSTLEFHQNDRELVILAYEAVTMTSPTEELIGYLSYVGIKRTLEILLTMQQSPTPVKNPIGFIKKAITQGWTPTTLPIKKERKIVRKMKISDDQRNKPIPFYNWLEE